MPPRLVELRRMLYIECTSNNPEVCTASHCNFAHSDAPATAVVRLSQGTHPALPAAAAHSGPCQTVSVLTRSRTLYTF